MKIFQTNRIYKTVSSRLPFPEAAKDKLNSYLRKSVTKEQYCILKTKQNKLLDVVSFKVFCFKGRKHIKMGFLRTGNFAKAFFITR